MSESDITLGLPPRSRLRSPFPLTAPSFEVSLRDMASSRDKDALVDLLRTLLSVSAPAPARAAAHGAQQRKTNPWALCKFGPSCTNSACTRIHTAERPACKYGSSCFRQGCHFGHPPSGAAQAAHAAQAGRSMHPPPPPRTSPRVTCCICLDRKPMSAGVVCPRDKAHFVCTEPCLQELVRAQACSHTSLQQHPNAVPCIGEGCTHAFPLAELLPQLRAGVSDAFLAGMAQAMRTVIEQRTAIAREVSELQSMDTIGRTTARCPRCAVPIEKNGGCNHMTCLSSGAVGCGHQFCWVCRTPWRTCNH